MTHGPINIRHFDIPWFKTTLFVILTLLCPYYANLDTVHTSIQVLLSNQNHKEEEIFLYVGCNEDDRRNFILSHNSPLYIHPFLFSSAVVSFLILFPSSGFPSSGYVLIFFPFYTVEAHILIRPLFVLKREKLA